MKNSASVKDKIYNRIDLARQVERWKLLNKKVVFTNGCFDILHKGHIELLSKAAQLGDILIVGLNADSSVKKLKGEERPVNDENFRSEIMAGLLIVDAVSLFEEDTPYELIETIVPDILVKGGDYKPEDVVGAETVIKNGGNVEIIPLVKGYSTTGIIQKIREL
ncbi:D-glycero-beta-D-manno-heptose 1-phosphate adenylyltransferase [Pollutibacter soli]|uniref:D-glycero-beta-D-manno-heptose 1-phosphate adenylyltransferase n=1 Tax=Pollutibacter soli TaxID=3034157 RepID=UPI0030134D34